MKVLIVCSGNSGEISAFVKDQGDSLIRIGIKVFYFQIRGKGAIGYLKNYKLLLKKIEEIRPQIIHAHYGISGLLSNLQRKIPVVVTYHGSDINFKLPSIFSKLSIRLSSINIFVSSKLADKACVRNPIIIPCGVNLNIFKPINKLEARAKLNLDNSKILLLFSSSFSIPVKNFPLAKQIMDQLKDLNVELIELKGYNRYEVAYLLNAVDVAIMTSFSEGSPQFIKEAMACNTPIVSVDVGTVREIIGEADNCFVSKEYDPIILSKYIRQVISSRKRSNGRDFINYYNESIIAKRIANIYSSIQ